MIYARIDLSQTNYEIMDNCKKLKCPFPKPLEAIYDAYCKHKKFKSVMPIFPEEYFDDKNEVYGYYDKEEKLVAFSLLRCYNNKNVEAVQFAWDYANPKLKIGYKSIRTECAIYRDLGYKQMLIDTEMYYKTEIQGFQLFGPIT